MVLEYPPTYPDIAPEISFETIDDESGELTEEETETLLEQLGTIVGFCLLSLLDPPLILG